VYQIIWRQSVKGFLVGGVPKFAFSIDFDGRPYISTTLPPATLPRALWSRWCSNTFWGV